MITIPVKPATGLCCLKIAFYALIGACVYCLVIVQGCSDGKWECHDGRRCLEERYICDGLIHCTDGSDENPDVCALWQCSPGRFKCLFDNKCIPNKVVCDGNTERALWNCRDGSDELDIVCSEWNCTEGYWKCNDNKCISVSRICNGRADCDDGSDELTEKCLQWNCTHKMWKCDDNLQCVHDYAVCDGKTGSQHDCFDMSDESNCKEWECANYMWKCDNLKCIPERLVCDGKTDYYDCGDGSDEANCENRPCPEGKWRCKNGYGCVDNHKVCDNVTENFFPYGCSDHSDEDLEVCRNWTCVPSFWKCQDNNYCIHKRKILDGEPNCLDGSDEDPSYHVGTVCDEGYFKCNNGQCIRKAYVCDGKNMSKGNCLDGSDEGSLCNEWECLLDYTTTGHWADWKCSDNLQCISAERVCDGRHIDCNDKSDEHNKLCGCPDSLEWPCKDGDGCLRNVQVCNGNNDCNDGSDEDSSTCLSWNCTEGMWKCSDSTQCVLQESWCDGTIHCFDRSDEANCSSFSCLGGRRKCANDVQCLPNEKICDGVIDCIDGSDELCAASCLPQSVEESAVSIMRRCKEDRTVCIPVERYCDRVPDCPLGSDETSAGCTCADWGLNSCNTDGKALCLYKEWSDLERVINSVCLNNQLMMVDENNQKQVDTIPVFSDYCENEEYQGKRFMKSASIYQEMDDDVIIVCLKDVFLKQIETVNLARNYIYLSEVKNPVLIENSTLHVTSDSTKLLFITFVNIIMKQCDIVLRNVSIIFHECQLNGVHITEEPKYLSISDLNQIEVVFDKSTFTCESSNALKTGGMDFPGRSAIKILITETSFRYCDIQTQASDMMLVISKSNLHQTSLHVRVKSYLRIPSIVNFEDTTFVMKETTADQVVSLKLTNAHVNLNNCTFIQTPVEITSGGINSKGSLYYVEITGSSFMNSHKKGNGGAVPIYSDVEDSKVYLRQDHFVKNRANRISSNNPGVGGAIFVQGMHLYLRIKDCFFINNSAMEAGSAIFASQGAIVTMENTVFEVEIDQQISPPVLYLLGTATSIIAKITIRKSDPALKTTALKVFVVEKLEDVTTIIVRCPQWYRHVLDYKSDQGANGKTNLSIQALTYVRYVCAVCPENFYTPSKQENTLSQSMMGMNSSEEANQACIECAYGAHCQGNNIAPRPNYWGYKDRDDLVFLQCPAGYCCSGNATPACSVYDACLGNRTGPLCGVCKEGFSVSILGGKCTPDNKCGHHQWFWSLALFGTFAYALWYTMKDDMIYLIIRSVTSIKDLCCKRGKKKVVPLETAPIHAGQIAMVVPFKVTPSCSADVTKVEIVESISDQSTGNGQGESLSVSSGQLRSDLSLDDTAINGNVTRVVPIDAMSSDTGQILNEVPSSSREAKDTRKSECLSDSSVLTHKERKQSSTSKRESKVSRELYESEYVGKGYFGIVTYFVQMAAVMSIQIEFPTTEQNDPLLDSLVQNIRTFLSIKLSLLSIDACPIIGLTMFGKHIYQLVFLFGIHTAWSVIFVINYILLGIVMLLERHYTNGCINNLRVNLKSFKLKLIRGIIEIIKYTYAGFCGFIFSSVICVKIKGESVWWYNATHSCYENWQIITIIFAVFYAIPFPLVILLGMKLLRQKYISAPTFVCFCFCPFIAICLILLNYRNINHKSHEDVKLMPSQLAVSDAGKAIISVLQGPFRDDSNHMTLYWEAMVSTRRLLTTAVTLLGAPSIEMIVITILSLLFLYQHVHVSPFQVGTSNYIEGLSLTLLTITAVINLLKAFLTESGVVPSGPSVLFFQVLELGEKIFVFIIIAAIVLIEFKLQKLFNRKEHSSTKSTNNDSSSIST